MSNDVNRMRFDIEIIKAKVLGACLSCDASSEPAFKRIFNDIAAFIEKHFEELEDE